MVKKVLLIGGSGKLGKKVLSELMKNGFKVAIFSRYPAKNISSHPGLLFFTGDITEASTLEEPIQWADFIINCSGMVSYKKSDKKILQQVNVQGVQNLMEVCTKHQKKIIHTSSAVVYGSAQSPLFFKEDTHAEGSYKSGYSYSKIEAEKIILNAPVGKVIFRPCSLICREKSTLKNLYEFYRQGFIPGFRGGASFALMTDAARAYIPAIQLLEQMHGCEVQIFNLGGNNLTIKEIYTLFGTRFRRKALYVPRMALYFLSLCNDWILLPFFKRSILTIENYHTANHFTFVDSSRAVKELGYQITAIQDLLKEIV